MNAPRLAAACISAIDIQTGAFIAWVTIIRCTPCRRALPDQQSLSRRRMSRCQNEIPPGDHADDVLHLGQQFAALGDGTNGRFSFEYAPGSRRRTSASRRRGPSRLRRRHSLDSGGIDAADGPIELDAAEISMPGTAFRTRKASGSGLLVALEDERAHAAARRAVATSMASIDRGRRRDSCARGCRSAPSSSRADRCRRSLARRRDAASHRPRHVANDERFPSDRHDGCFNLAGREGDPDDPAPLETDHHRRCPFVEADGWHPAASGGR